MSIRNLDKLFRPQSIAVIGASAKPKSVGSALMTNLLRAGFAGPILPVNPSAVAVHGIMAYRDIVIREAIAIFPADQTRMLNLCQELSFLLSVRQPTLRSSRPRGSCRRILHREAHDARRFVRLTSANPSTLLGFITFAEDHDLIKAVHVAPVREHTSGCFVPSPGGLLQTEIAQRGSHATEDTATNLRSVF